MILAANVVHASRNLPAALKRIRQLLAPGGALVLLETTKHQACFDMSIGLIEGWRHFEDSERAEHPLLDAKSGATSSGAADLKSQPLCRIPIRLLLMSVSMFWWHDVVCTIWRLRARWT